MDVNPAPSPDGPATAIPPPGGAPPPEPGGPAADRAPALAPGPGAAPPPTAGPRGPHPALVALLILVCGIVSFWNVWKRDFWGPSEPRLALVARAMETSGDWITPAVDGAPWLDLPPAVPWLAAACHRLSGWDPRLSYRLPIGLAAAFGLWLTYVAGKKLFDGRIGFLAAAIQASTAAYFWRSSWLDDDLLFAVFCQLALTAFAVTTRRGASRSWVWIGWAGLAGAALAKSAFLAAGLVFGSFGLLLLFEPGAGTFRNGLRRVLSPGGLGLFLLLTAPWYIAAAIRHGPELLQEHFIRQHFARLFQAQSHPEPPYYYLLVAVVGFLPWSLFLPLAFLHAKDRLRRQGERLAFLAALFILVSLSFVSSKKPGFILAAWPPLALSIAAALFETREWFSLWEDFLREGMVKALPFLLRLPIIAAVAVAGIYAAGYLPAAAAFVLSLLGRWPIDEAEGNRALARLEALIADKDGMIYALALFGGAAVLCYLVARRVHRLTRSGESPRAAFEFACATLFLFFVPSFLYESLNDVRSGRTFLATVELAVGEAPLATVGYRPAVVAYHLARPPARFAAPDPDHPDDPATKALEAYLKRPEAVYVLASSKDIKGVRQEIGPLLHELMRGNLGWAREFVLATNRPREAPAK